MGQTHQNAVTVKVFGGLRSYLDGGRKTIGIDPGATVQDLLATLRQRTPELAGHLMQGLADGYLNVLVNGRNIRFLSSLDTPLSPGDSVAFLPPVGGG